MPGSVVGDHDFSLELRTVLRVVGAPAITLDRLSRKAYDLETKCAALRLVAKDAETEAARLSATTRAQEERIAELEQRLEESERMNDAIARATKED